MPSATEPAKSTAPSFEEQVRVHLERVQTAVRDVVAPVLGSHRIRGAELVDSLGIDPRLAWKVARVIAAEDPLTVVKYLPGERGTQLFLRAAERREAPRSAIAAARSAFKDLGRFVETEAGDRQSFRMMVAGHLPQEVLDAGLEHRRAAFEQNGYIFGVQARAQIHTYLVQRNSNGVELDIATIRGFAGLRRIRPQTPWRISRFYRSTDNGEIHAEFAREPLDPSCSQDEAPILKGFCSDPIPSVRRVTGSQGIVDCVLAESDVGNAQLITCLTGEVVRAAGPSDSPALGAFAPLRTPCEVLVMDVFVQRGLLRDGPANMKLCSDLFNDRPGVNYSPADQLPLPARVEQISTGTKAPAIREMPRYSEMIQFGFDRLRWNLAQFECYRTQLRYPPLPATLIVQWPLADHQPEKDAALGCTCDACAAWRASRQA